MNSETWPRTIGLISSSIAGLLFVLPLQVLLRECSRKREDGGGILAALLILAPLWLSLLIALSCAIHLGAWASLPFSGGTRYALGAWAIVSMALISFMRFEFPRHPNRLVRFLARLPMQVFPSLTLALVLAVFAPILVPPPVSRLLANVWFAIGGFSSCLGALYLLYRVGLRFGLRFRGILWFMERAFRYHKEQQECVARLSPEENFSELIPFLDRFHPRGIRESALLKLRAYPQFVSRLALELQQGAADKALAAVASVVWSPGEIQVLAAPSQDAMNRYLDGIQSELRYMPAPRRKHCRKWAEKLFGQVAEKMAPAGLEFAPALGTVPRLFDSDKVSRR